MRLFLILSPILLMGCTTERLPCMTVNESGEVVSASDQIFSSRSGGYTRSTVTFKMQNGSHRMCAFGDLGNESFVVGKSYNFISGSRI